MGEGEEVAMIRWQNLCLALDDVRTDLAALQRPDARAGDDNRVAFGRGDVGLRKVEVEYRALSDRERELVGPPDAARRRQFETIGTDRERRDIVAAVRAHRDTARQDGVDIDRGDLRHADFGLHRMIGRASGGGRVSKAVYITVDMEIYIKK